LNSSFALGYTLLFKNRDETFPKVLFLLQVVYMYVSRNEPDQTTISYS